MDIKESIVLPMTAEEEYRNAAMPMPRGPNDLEVIIQRLESHNKHLHQYTTHLETELIKEREAHYKLKSKIENLLNEYRNKGVV
jgi:hypothetical protein